MYKARNIAAQVEQCMQFYRGFGRSKWSPGENRKTQVYRGGIERINGFFEIDSEWFVGIKFSRNSNQTLRKVRIDSPISYHVGVGQCISCDDRAKSHAVKLGLLSTKTGLYISQALSISLRLSRYLSGSLDISQALSISQLSKSHAKKLVEAGKRFYLAVALVSRYASAKGGQWNMLQQLRKHQFSIVHIYLLRICSPQHGRSRYLGSNRDQKNMALKLYQSYSYVS